MILGESFEIAKSFNLPGLLSNSSTLAIQDQRLFLCCRENGLFVLEADTLSLVDHIRPPASVNFLTCHLATINSWLLCHSRGFTFVDPVSLDLSPDYPCPIKDIIRVSGSSPALIFAVPAEGIIIASTDDGVDDQWWGFDVHFIGLGYIRCHECHPPPDFAEQAEKTKAAHSRFRRG